MVTAGSNMRHFSTDCWRKGKGKHRCDASHWPFWLTCYCTTFQNAATAQINTHTLHRAVLRPALSEDKITWVWRPQLNEQGGHANTAVSCECTALLLQFVQVEGAALQQVDAVLFDLCRDLIQPLWCRTPLVECALPCHVCLACVSIVICTSILT